MHPRPLPLQARLFILAEGVRCDRDGAYSSKARIIVKDEDHLCSPPDCSGHGQCVRAFTTSAIISSQDGICACDPDWLGPGCSYTCPVSASGAMCGGHGVCELSTAAGASCRCNTSTATGFWGAPDCFACAPDYYGADCQVYCNGCSARGVCNSNPGPADPVCLCQHGAWGPSCEFECPGSPGSDPCSGHGQCDDGAFGTYALAPRAGPGCLSARLVLSVGWA